MSKVLLKEYIIEVHPEIGEGNSKTKLWIKVSKETFKVSFKILFFKFIKIIPYS
jgi:hypothetical protein